MMRHITHRMRRFFRREDGTATIEFCILFIPMFSMVIMAAELGMIHTRYAMLERAVDATVRDIRLGTGTAPSHDQIRDVICGRAGYIDDCENDLRIEMVLLDPFQWTNPPTDVDCIDETEEVNDPREFANGGSNQLMFMRVCAKYDPILPHIGMADHWTLDGAGQYALVTTSAFVQEPR